MKKRMVLALLVSLLVAGALFAQGAKPVGENSYTGTILSISDENGIFEFMIQDDTGKIIRFIPTADCETILPLGSYRAGDSVEISDYLMVTDNLASAKAIRWITALVSNEWLKSITLQQSTDIVAAQSAIPIISPEDIVPASLLTIEPTGDSKASVGLDLRLILLIIIGGVVLLAVILLVIILAVGSKNRKKLGDF